MKRPLALLLACALGLSLLSGCSSPEGCGPFIEAGDPLCDGSAAPPPSEPFPYTEKLSVNPQESEMVNEAMVHFGLDLLKQARAVNGEKAMASDIDHAPLSTLVSPLSVALALSMTANGADGGTLAQFEDLFGTDLDELNAACAQFMFDYQGLTGSSQCRIADSLWVDLNGGIYEEFVTRCRSFYSAQVFEVELSEPRIVNDINGWVSDKTGGLIPSLIDQPFGPETALVLVNALYLKNQWALKFDPLDTHPLDFHRAGGFASLTDFLQHFDTTLSYIRGESVQGVVLPYDDGRLAFFALLPDNLYPDTPGLGDWLNALEADELDRLLNSREGAMFLHFAMPKFEAEWKGDLSDTLSALGLTDAFDPEQANFSQLGNDPNGYFIDQVVHAVKLSVNEQGTEAAAATAVPMEPGAMAPPEEGVTLILDRPFLYGIIDLQTGVPLFLGTYE